jgi:hypothetical protein
MPPAIQNKSAMPSLAALAATMDGVLKIPTPTTMPTTMATALTTESVSLGLAGSGIGSFLSLKGQAELIPSNGKSF